jgi:hypothetical protein
VRGATGGFGESFGQESVLNLPLLLGKRFMNVNAFIESAHRDPGRPLQRVGMSFHKALRRKAVTNLAVELDKFALSSLVKRSLHSGQTNDTASSRKPGFFAWLMLRLRPFSVPFFFQMRIRERVNFTNKDGISARGTQ